VPGGDPVLTSDSRRAGAAEYLQIVARNGYNDPQSPRPLISYEIPPLHNNFAMKIPPKPPNTSKMICLAAVPTALFFKPIFPTTFPSFLTVCPPAVKVVPRTRIPQVGPLF